LKQPPATNCVQKKFASLREVFLIAATVSLAAKLCSSCDLQVCKDYIGILTEESLRKNFTLIYELVLHICNASRDVFSATHRAIAFP